mgnify:FL=1
MDCSDRPLNPDFPLNFPRYQGAEILLARDNFGCGSSREHAPWAIEDSGFRVLIAPSFADIFFNNCFKNALLPIVLKEDIIDILFEEMYQEEGYSLTVDLARQVVVRPNGEEVLFEIDEFRKHCLVNGLDDIGLTLQDADAIREFEQSWQQRSPWLFNAGP